MTWKKSGVAKDVDDYLAGVDPVARATLEKVRAAIRSAAPQAIEGISYRMPVFKLGTTPLVGFIAAKEHCSLFTMSPAVMTAHQAELKSYSTAKGTVRFPIGEPPPATLVRKLVKARIAEVQLRRATKR